MSFHHVHQTRGAYIFIVGLEILHHVIFISSGWHEIKLSAAKTDVAKLPKRASACMDTLKRGVHAHQVTPPPLPRLRPCLRSQERATWYSPIKKRRLGWGKQARSQNLFMVGEGLETRWVCDEVNIFGENIFIHVIKVFIHTHKNNQTCVIYKCFFPFFRLLFCLSLYFFSGL